LSKSYQGKNPQCGFMLTLRAIRLNANFYQFCFCRGPTARLPVDLAGALRTKPRAFVVSRRRPTCNQRKRKVAFVCPAIKPHPSHPLAMRRVVTREFQRFALTSDSEDLVSHWSLRPLEMCRVSLVFN